jgi:cytochrome P450
VTTASEFDALDPERIRRLFDLRSNVYASRGGAFEDDPYPAFHRLRETGPVHEGVVGPLIGYHGDAFFQGLPYPELPHFSAFDFATCDAVFRDGETYISKPPDGGLNASILYMDGAEHRRYRALVQPSFLPKRARWWIENWIERTVHALLDRIEGQGSADLNVDVFAAIPLLTITGSFGISIEDALDIRAAVTSDGVGLGEFLRIVPPIIAARREEQGDDLISVLVEAEVADEDGVTHRLTDDEILGFVFLLLAAGSGTTWKQLGITMVALLRHPDWLDAVRQDGAVLRPVIEESLRWMPTDPMFSRFIARDAELGGVAVPQGGVMHICLAAANRDPARWERPDEFDPSRAPQPHIGFGDGAHICLGMHVARAELATAIGAVVDRLPDLRLDPDAPEPRIIGLYERGPTTVPVRFG